MAGLKLRLPKLPKFMNKRFFKIIVVLAVLATVVYFLRKTTKEKFQDSEEIEFEEYTDKKMEEVEEFKGGCGCGM